jgi:hypothetical protein
MHGWVRSPRDRLAIDVDFDVDFDVNVNVNVAAER